MEMRHWLLLATVLVVQLGLTLAQGFYFPGQESTSRESPVIQPRSGGRLPSSKVHRGGKVFTPQTPGNIRGRCNAMPKTPISSALKCSSYGGCRADCLAGTYFPNGETRIAIRCRAGEWVPQEPYQEIPNCAPVCQLQCQNGGVCVGSNQCQCPTGYSGAQCEQRDERCTEPTPQIFFSSIRCSDTRCSVSCQPGYKTADDRTAFEIKCTEELGWTAVGDHTGSIPACQPICQPKCENGGTCVRANRCQCPRQFRGPACQWSVENCNPNTKLNFNGGHNCTETGGQFGCQLICGEGAVFSSPPAAIYQCDYSIGEYQPQPIPSCTYGTPPPPLPVTPPTILQLPVIPEARQCSLWSGKHVKTFDGLVYSFTGGCDFTALQDDVTSLFRVTVVRGCERPDCSWDLRLTVDRTVLLLAAQPDGSVIVTAEQSLYGEVSELITLPAELDGIVLETEGRNKVVVHATNIDLTLHYSRDMIVVLAESSLWGTVSGLCGTMDGIVQNDLLSDGLWGTLENFSNQRVCPAGYFSTELGCNDGGIQQQAMRVCSMAFQRPDLYAPCQNVNYKAYLKACMVEFCHSFGLSVSMAQYGSLAESTANATICPTIAAYAAECERVTSASISWRSEDFCPLPCPAGQIFSPCGVLASGRCGAAVSSSWVCEEGCACPEGLLMDGGQCVDAGDCSCQHNGVQYQAGDQITQDCNSCICSSGSWLCTEVACPSQCVVAGDPHYQTFDGVRYDFQGKCSYYLVQAYGYNIQTENVPCSGAISEKLNFHPSTMSSEPSCTKSVRIEYEGLTVDLKQNLLVLINGETPPMVPWWVNGVYVKYASSMYLSVTLPNGLEVWWDGETRAVIHSPPTLGDNIKGLCGNNNGNQRDDFLTPEGDIETNAIAFASKWKVDETCDDRTLSHGHPCEVHSDKYPEASRYCDALVKSPAFQECHKLVDPGPYVKNCEYDLCSCRSELADCFCVHLADYAAACADRGLLPEWRAEIGICGKGCPFGQQYEVCGDSCARTCFDLATALKCDRHCVEGCQCPEGQTLNAEEHCIPISTCPCVHSNKEYHSGYERLQKDADNSELCTCVNARWVCNKENEKLRLVNPNITTCDASKHKKFVECRPTHMITCKNHRNSRQEVSKSLYEECKWGCVCADGYVLDVTTDECVTAAQCPCHHNGKTYQNGGSFSTECRKCTCNGGMWDCDDDDELPCEGVCTAWGNSHYETFDGRIYDIEGDCQYMLAKGKLDLEQDINNQFEVIVTNVPCGAGSTCPKALQISVGHGQRMEKISLEADQSLPPSFKLTRLAVRQAGAFAFVEAPKLGLVVQWDYGTRIYVRLSKQWKGKIAGLCGNFNDNPGDDFRGPSGLLENTAVQFADTHKLKNYCPTTQATENSCKLHPERRLFAVRRCAALKSPLFVECHQYLDVEPFFERCVQDTCACTGGGDCECLCTAVAAYGQACSRKGVHVHWRSNDLCPMQCDTDCSQYSPCVSACPPKTCENRVVYEDITGMCADDTCVEGCQPKPCPPGRVYHNSTLDSCVRENDCETECQVIDGQQYFEGDVITRDECHVCYCTRHHKKCRGSPCQTTPPPPTTPIPDGDITEGDDLDVCKEGWSVYVNSNKPIAFTRPRDVERIPAFIEPPVGTSSELYALVDIVVPNRQQISGRVTFIQNAADQTLNINGDIYGLDPGEYVLQVHEKDQCDVTSGIYNPTGATRARPVVNLGSILSQSGHARLSQGRLSPEKASLFGEQSLHGLALVLHSQVTGSAGGPHFCGVIKRAYDTNKETFGFCAENQVHNVTCRTAVTHLSPDKTGENVTCTREKGLVCSSDYVCQDYELRVFCDCSVKPTQTPTTTPQPTRSPAPCVEGWTEWMSGHKPGNGDWTDTEDIRSLRKSFSFCDEKHVNAIKCRTKQGHEDVARVGGGAQCNLNIGLSCPDVLGYCPDFEVQFYCDCRKPPKPECTPGSMYPHEIDCHKYYRCDTNSVKVEESCGPDRMFRPGSDECDLPASVITIRPECREPPTTPVPATTGPTTTGPTTTGSTTTGSTTPIPAEHCDEIHPLKKHPTDCHAYYQCIRTANNELDAILQSCGQHMMFNPITMTCDWMYNVQALRPECGASTTEPPISTSSVGTQEVTPGPQSTTTPRCPLHEVYDDCKIRCDQLCHNFEGVLEAQGFCQIKDSCMGGCTRGTRGCPSSYVWKNDTDCVPSSYCNCRLPNGKPLGPGQVQLEDDGCTKFQCVDNQLLSDNTGCTTTVSPTPPLPKCGFWGDWIDTTDPTVGDYEVETLPWWEQDTFCVEANLKSIECQVASTGAHYHTAGDVGVTCDIKSGLACSNKAQPDGLCHNYRIRYYCSCDIPPTTPATPSTTILTSTTTPTPSTTSSDPPITTPPQPTDCEVDRFIPLLYGNEPLADSSFSASSSILPDASPEFAKITGEHHDVRRSWMPAQDNQRQYLQVDLGEEKKIYAVKVRGNYAFRAAVDKFELWFGDDGENFWPLTDAFGVTQGLTSINPLGEAEPVVLLTPVTARHVRLVPRTWQTRIALKLEVYGCRHVTDTTTPLMPRTTITPPTPPPLILPCDEQQFMKLLYGDPPLPDSSFTSTSDISPAQTAKYAKITGSADDSMRAWMPSNNNQDQYLQVDLGKVERVYGVTVMGNKLFETTVTEFQILYSEDDRFYTYVVDQNSQPAKLTAQEPLSSSPGRVLLPRPVEGRFFRIFPTDWVNRISLKLELFGCNVTGPPTTPPPTTPQPPQPRCFEEMGLESGRLHDSFIKVSSQLSDDHGASAVRPDRAGWIPKQSNNKQYIRQYIRVNLTTSAIIDGFRTTGVTVKGREKFGYPNEPNQVRYIGSFSVRYSHDGIKWIPVYNKVHRAKVFPGHTERTALSSIQNDFELPLGAQYLEIMPLTWSDDGIGATLEVLGCYIEYPPPVDPRPTPTPTPPSCNLCDGMPAMYYEGCEACRPQHWWNGTACIADKAYCPCFYDDKAYAVGEPFESKDCQECTCELYGKSTCVQRHETCPPCPPGTVIEIIKNCNCSCIVCPEDTRICPTSGDCLSAHLWCDDITHCPDDEDEDCVIVKTPPTLPPTTPTTPTTPRPGPPAYCKLKGNSFSTFDRVEYKYDTCHHTLTKHREGLFDVTVHQVCSTECRREVRINIGDENVTLVPGVGVEFGGYSYNKQQAKSVRSKQGAFKISSSFNGMIVFDATPFNFIVVVNNVGDLVIGMDRKNEALVQGLCGNADRITYNDMIKPDGTAVSTTPQFGDSWAVPGEDESCSIIVRLPCSSSQDALDICMNIRKPPFSNCHSTVSLGSFINSCKDTACHCLDSGEESETCRCKALTDYANECLSHDKTIDLPLWRTQHHCPEPNCTKPGEVYRDCYRYACEPTCENSEPCQMISDQCFSGCGCPDGTVRKGDECVETPKCRNCTCRSSPGGRFTTFDKTELIFNTNCSYQAAGRNDPNGRYNFKVIVDNNNCQKAYGRVTCTDDVRVEWDTNVILLKRSRDLVEVFVNGAMVEGFYHPYLWGTVSQSPKSAVVVAVTALELDVSLHPSTGDLFIGMPSAIYAGTLDGVCGNCIPGAEYKPRKLTDWQLDDECIPQPIPTPGDLTCPPPPSVDQDPCQKIMNKTLFGACHNLEDPAPIVAACESAYCTERDSNYDVCGDLEQYARRCYERGLCLEWRSSELCSREHTCPYSTEYRQCTGSCINTCTERDCPYPEMDGCFCPEGQVYENNQCVDETTCNPFCDNEGHRYGDKWKQDKCTICECPPTAGRNQGKNCTTTTCATVPPLDCRADEEQIPVEAIRCCDPLHVCKPKPTTTVGPPTTVEPPTTTDKICPLVVTPTCNTAMGEGVKTIIDIDGCENKLCDCVPDDQRPSIAPPRPLLPGEIYVTRSYPCVPPRIEIECPANASCPAPRICRNGLVHFMPAETLEKKPCCPPRGSCVPPPETCKVRLDVGIDIRTFSDDDEEGFVLKRAGEVWSDGFCLNCTCREVFGGNPLYQPVCVQMTCTGPSEDDLANYVYVVDEDEDDCCPFYPPPPACRYNGQEYQAGESWQPSIGGLPVDPCLWVHCELRDTGRGVIKVSHRQECSDNCSLGHTYEPAAAPDCCGQCKRTSCTLSGIEYAEGETWKSKDRCTEYACERDFYDNQLTVMSMSKGCRDVSDCPMENRYLDETGCCQRCNRTDNCHIKLVPPAETIRMFKQDGCVNLQEVEAVISCKGACDSMAFFDTDTSMVQSGCKCCSVTATRQLDLLLSCEATGVTIFRTFTVPDGCACSKCDSSSSELQDSPSADRTWQQATGGDWGQMTGGDPFYKPADYVPGGEAEEWPPIHGDPFGPHEDQLSLDNGKSIGFGPIH